MASVKVVVRVRPFNDRELNMNSKCIVKMEDKKTIIFNQKASDNENTRDKTFTYDHSYWSFDHKDKHFVSQEQVFWDLGKDVIDCAFEGYNNCVFAYGQTGSGKSWSMMGPTGTKNEGLIPRICRGLFDNMKIETNRDHNFRTEVSYLEIYNEKVRDLLRTSSKHNLKVREHPIEGPFVEDLSKHIVVNYEDIEELMNKGNENRTTAATRQAKFIGNISSETVSKIHLVDLAGSERADSTNTMGIRLVEGGNINKSLLTLINVISTLADNSLEENRNRKFYIPYRDSVLTWLLKDSLGGNSKTIMVATISPACVNYSETLNTLRYANRAKSIINKPTINEDQNVKLIRELRDEIIRLKALIDNDQTNEEIKVQKIENLTANLDVDQFDCRWKAFHELFDEDDHCLELIRKEQKALTILSKKQPYLIGFDDYILSNSGIKFFLLNPGRTVIAANPSLADIVLQIDNDEYDESFYLENDSLNVILYPVNGSKCFINNKLIYKPTKLETGSILMIGKRNLFRFNCPLQTDDELFKKDIYTDKIFLYEAIKNYIDENIRKDKLDKDIRDLEEKINNEKLLLKHQIQEYQEKFNAQKKENELLVIENELAKNKIDDLVLKINDNQKSKSLDNTHDNSEYRNKINQLTVQYEIALDQIKILTIELNELKEKNLTDEKEKIEYLKDKEKIQKEKKQIQRLKDEIEKQSLALRGQLNELSEIKNVYNKLVEKNEKDKILIEKEIDEPNKKRVINLEKLNEQRINMMCHRNGSENSSTYQHVVESDEIVEYIQNDEQDLESMTEFLTKHTKLIHPAKSKSKLQPNLNLMSWQS